MAKLTEGHASGGAIGREGLKAFCAQLNARRAQCGIRERYYLAERDGELTLLDEVQERRR